MITEYEMSCGCRFKQYGTHVKECDGLPSIEIDYYNIRNCPKTWSLFSTGNTKGVFQLEKNLGQHWCKEINPWSLEELCALIALIRPGCISGDTKIVEKFYTKGNNKKRISIKMKDLYKKFHNKKTKYKNQIVSVDETSGELFNNNIKNVIFTGNKEVFKIIFTKSKRPRSTSEYTLECTEDHKLLTPSGWKELKDLKYGDRFLVIKRKSNKKNKKHIDGFKNFREICFQNYEYKCAFCDWNEGSLDVNHIDENRYKNNDPENLSFLCPNHHRMYTENKISKEDLIKNKNLYKLKKMIDCEWAVFFGKESLGVKDVYDISVDGPNHNFIAGNVIVHNCLESLIENKSITQHYADRKNLKEDAIPFHPALTDILKDTYQVITYQEQILRIANEIAGYTLGEADVLRKAIGKKDANAMQKLRESFISGCLTVNAIDEKTAKDLFDMIEKSQRYLFNKCLTPDTVVETKDGFKTLEDLKIGEFVNSPNGFVEVVNKYDNGDKEIYEITLENGYSIKCTMDHKFLCKNGEILELREIIDRDLEIVVDCGV